MLVVIQNLPSQLTRKGEVLVVTWGRGGREDGQNLGRCPGGHTAALGPALLSPNSGILGTSLPLGACFLICEMDILPFGSHRQMSWSSLQLAPSTKKSPEKETFLTKLK